MKRQPRKLKWTKTHRALRGKEMIVDQNLLLGRMAQRRNEPVKYDRNVMEATLKAMERIEEIRAKREKVYARRRLRGKAQREARLAQDRKEVATNSHLIAKELADEQKVKERQELEPMAMLEEEDEIKLTQPSQVLGMERQRQKRKRKMLVGGGVEDEMEVD